MGWTGAINAQVCAIKSHRIFRKEHTRSTPLEPNSCSGGFHSVFVHLAMFCYYTELGAKWVELVQLMKKFVLRNRIRVFRNERTRSTPLEPNSYSGAFCCVSVHLAMFYYYMELGAKWVELVLLINKFVPRNRIRVFCNERTRNTPLDAKLMNWCVLECWVHFGLFRYWMKLNAK
jgi:hypothetical protein